MTPVTTAVILCGGKGTRMGALVENCPKPLLRLSTGETLLESKLKVLPDSITKVILVVGYLGDMIRDHIGTTYEGKEVVYVQQPEDMYGTGIAVSVCAPYIEHERVLILMGDDIYVKEDLEKLTLYPYSILLAYYGEEKFNASWQTEVNEKGELVTFHEKVPDVSKRTGIINTAAYVVGKELLTLPPIQAPNGEYQLTLAVVKLVEQGIPFQAVKATYWKQVTAPEDLEL